MTPILYTCLSLLGFVSPPTGFDQWRLNQMIYLKEKISLDTERIHRIDRRVSRLNKKSVDAVNILQARIARYQTKNEIRFFAKWYQNLQTQIDQLPQKKGWREWTLKIDQKKYEDPIRLFDLALPKQLQVTFDGPDSSIADQHFNSLYQLLRKTLPYLQPKYRAFNRMNYLNTHSQKIIGAYPQIALEIEHAIYEISEDHRSPQYSSISKLGECLDKMDLIWGQIVLTRPHHIELYIKDLAELLETLFDHLKRYDATGSFPQADQQAAQ